MEPLVNFIIARKWVASGIVYSNVADDDGQHCNPSCCNAVDCYLLSVRSRDICQTTDVLPQVL